MRISVEKHRSVGLAVVAHHDYAGNPVSYEEQLHHLREAVRYLRQRYTFPIIALWVDADWQVHEVDVAAALE